MVINEQEIDRLESEEEEEYSETDDSGYEDSDSDDDPTYSALVERTQRKLSNLSIGRNKTSKPRDLEEIGVGNNEQEQEGKKTGDAEKADISELIRKMIDAGQVEKLKVDHCKMYLKEHRLRRTGKKDVLIQRIKEHQEILNGKGEEKYPPSGFVINCKGDACTGDVVMFEQTVYEGSRRFGPPCGKRTVAGRIVKESYGAAKQQHTFTIEVLWSKGDKPLPPLQPLLIKGRNLYRLKTMRMKWDDGAARQKILQEKHNRGQVARSDREARILEKEARKAFRANRIPKEEEQRGCQKKKKTSKGQSHQLHTSKENIPPSNSVPEPFPRSSRETPNCQFIQRPASPLQFRPVSPNLHQPASPLHFRPKSSNLHQPAPPLHFRPVSPKLLQPHLERRSLEISYLSRLQHQQASSPLRGKRCPAASNAQQRPLVSRTYHQHQYTDTAPIDHRSSLGINQRNSSDFCAPRVSPNRYHGNPQRPYHHAQQKQVCRYYARGRCYYADQCKYLHESNGDEPMRFT
ncbi:hypothetical protein Droror1_Dr00013407 [Drosera rotundifolia]